MTDPSSEDTRKVVLARPLTINGVDHDADATVELPAKGYPDGADQMVRDGRARWADGTTDGRPTTGKRTRSASSTTSATEA